MAAFFFMEEKIIKSGGYGEFHKRLKSVTTGKIIFTPCYNQIIAREIGEKLCVL